MPAAYAVRYAATATAAHQHHQPPYHQQRHAAPAPAPEDTYRAPGVDGRDQAARVWEGLPPLVEAAPQATAAAAAAAAAAVVPALESVMDMQPPPHGADHAALFSPPRRLQPSPALVPAPFATHETAAWDAAAATAVPIEAAAAAPTAPPPAPRHRPPRPQAPPQRREPAHAVGQPWSARSLGGHSSSSDEPDEPASRAVAAPAVAVLVPASESAAAPSSRALAAAMPAAPPLAGDDDPELLLLPEGDTKEARRARQRVHDRLRRQRMAEQYDALEAIVADLTSEAREDDAGGPAGKKRKRQRMEKSDVLARTVALMSALRAENQRLRAGHAAGGEEGRQAGQLVAVGGAGAARGGRVEVLARPVVSVFSQPSAMLVVEDMQHRVVEWNSYMLRYTGFDRTRVEDGLTLPALATTYPKRLDLSNEERQEALADARQLFAELHRHGSTLLGPNAPRSLTTVGQLWLFGLGRGRVRFRYSMTLVNGTHWLYVVHPF